MSQTPLFAQLVEERQEPEVLEYLCDVQRHLVCRPYSVANLHRMAADLDIKRCWFHQGSRHPHYDIPKLRIAEITARCTLVSPYEILATIKGGRDALVAESREILATIKGGRDAL